MDSISKTNIKNELTNGLIGIPEIVCRTRSIFALVGFIRHIFAVIISIAHPRL